MFNLQKYLIIDVESNALKNPTTIHVICGRNQDNETFEFRNPCTTGGERQRFQQILAEYNSFVGHNFIQYDRKVISSLLGIDIPRGDILDTLVLSRLIRYDLPGGHSLRAWGERVGTKKEGADITDWSKLTELMVQRCHSDTEIPQKIIDRYRRFLTDPDWQSSLELEHFVAYFCSLMEKTGFPFDTDKALKMYEEIKHEVDGLDKAIFDAFPPVPKPGKEITPRATKTGTINLSDFRWFTGSDLSCFSIGAPFTRFELEEFNPGSPKQIVSRLNAAGWKPTDKTKGHMAALKNKKTTPKEKMNEYKEFGWKVNEENLSTLPVSAPEAAKSLSSRIILQSRLSDLEEWLELKQKDQENVWRVFGSFSPIGAWTHRLSHSKPNLANVPTSDWEKADTDFKKHLCTINDNMRSLFHARKGYRQIGTDADGLQMRVFAHYVNSPDLIEALINGRKEDETDIHSLHKRKLGQPCKSRADAKTFIYAFLLGAGIAKVAEILGCDTRDAARAVDSFIESYPGLAELKRTIIPKDAEKGYFIGLDGRKVVCNSEHLMLAGYLQNGEKIIMAGACREWVRKFEEEKIPFEVYTWPHDEWQTGVPDNDDLVAHCQAIQVQAIRNQAVRLGLNCPLEGTSSSGYTWLETH